MNASASVSRRSFLDSRGEKKAREREGETRRKSAAERAAQSEKNILGNKRAEGRGRPRGVQWLPAFDIILSERSRNLRIGGQFLISSLHPRREPRAWNLLDAAAAFLPKIPPASRGKITYSLSARTSTYIYARAVSLEREMP